MKKALIRLEDVGPGGEFGTEEKLLKLCVVADFLAREGVPFHVAMIPRFVDPQAGYDKSIADLDDPFVQKFLRTIHYLRQRGASIGMHGYTHQYGNAVSADGFEFFYPECESDCPPDDPPAAYLERTAFERSYASSRMRKGFAAVRRSGVPIDWFETPHYAAHGTPRNIIEGWVGLIFENDPRQENANMRIKIDDLDSPLYRGVVYVPTPLFYVDGSHPDQAVEQMCKDVASYGPEDLAGFFYHAFLEFPFIQLANAGNGRMRVTYDENSYLHRLIRGFKQLERTFVPILSVVPFAPSARRTNVFPGNDVEVLTGDFDGDERSELLFWERRTGDWSVLRVRLDDYPNRNVPIGEPKRVLTGWAKGTNWQAFVGDVNGDGRADVIVLDRERGQWHVALSDGEQLVPTVGERNGVWLDGFGSGKGWVPLVGDFNGDGKADVAAYHVHTGELRVALSTGQHFAEVFVAGGGDEVRQGVGQGVGHEAGHEVGHEAGLGGLHSTDTGVRRTKIVAHRWLTGWVKGAEWTVAVGDLNGDGRADLVAWNRRTGDWRVALSDGQRLIPAIGHMGPIWRREFGVGKQWHLLVGDLDGDGLDDVVLVDPSQGQWLAARNERDRFVPHDTPFGPWAAGAQGEPFLGVFTADKCSSIGVRHPHLRGGTVDFAVSLLGKRTPH